MRREDKNLEGLGGPHESGDGLIPFKLLQELLQPRKVLGSFTGPIFKEKLLLEKVQDQK